MQQLFGGVDPSSKMLADRYKEAPELAAYLTARASGAKITLHTHLLHTPLAWIYYFFLNSRIVRVVLHASFRFPIRELGRFSSEQPGAAEDQEDAVRRPGPCQ